MKTRDAVLQYQYTMTDAETKTLEPNLKDPISAIYFEVQAANGASGNLGNYISDIITKIEVVDGSDVLASLSLAELQALEFYKTGKNPLMFYSEQPSGQQRGGGYLLFGRHLWDPDYALDPSAYKNLQLRVTANKAAIRAAGATGFAAGNTIKLTAVAKIIEQGATPRGFLMQKVIDSFTSVGSGDKRIDLPVDYPYRFAMLRAHLQGYDIDELVSDLKLTCDTDKFIPFNRKVQQLDAEALLAYGELTWQQMVYAAYNTQVRTVLNKEPRVLPLCHTVDTARIVWASEAWSSRWFCKLYTHAGVTVTDAEDIWTSQHGHALHATLPVQFGLADQPDTWFNAPEYGKVELVATQAYAGGVCSLVLEQVRPG